VTHKLQEHAAHVWQMVNTLGASIFVSGSAQQMPANVVGGGRVILCVRVCVCVRVCICMEETFAFVL